LPELRVYLSGQLSIERGDVVVRSADLPSRQGRLIFALLALHGGQPVARSAIADAIWPSNLPEAWESGLSAVLSKLRSALKPIGIDIASEGGNHHIVLPQDAWLDVQIARASLDEAEGMLRNGDYGGAWGAAGVAAVIGRREFLPGEEGEWITGERRKLRATRLRALEIWSEISLANGEHELASRLAAECVELDPFRESGYRLLMRALTAQGNSGEALRIYEECRRVLMDELGADPSPQTRELHRSLLDQT
jgi:DNA-binding SARP family transcriptional activator